MIPSRSPSEVSLILASLALASEPGLCTPCPGSTVVGGAYLSGSGRTHGAPDRAEQGSSDSLSARASWMPVRSTLRKLRIGSEEQICLR